MGMALFVLILLVSFNRTINRLTKPVTFLVVFSLLSSALISSYLYLKNIEGELILSANDSNYIKIEDQAIQMVRLDDRPLKIINAPENRSAAVIRLQNFDNTFLYLSLIHI